MYLSIIVPAYNEEHRIKKTLLEIDSYLRTRSWDYEIIVVNDGSKDQTSDVVKSLMPRITQLKLIDLPANRGKGYAVGQGMLGSRGEFCLFMDADHSTHINQVERLLPHIRYGYDIVISSRHLATSVITEPQPAYRVALGTLFSYFVSAVVPLGIKDTQNGFKLFTRWAASSVFSQQRIYRWAFDVEILAISKKQGYKVKEVPVIWRNDDRSQMNFKGMIKMALEVLTIRKNLITGQYSKPAHVPHANIAYDGAN